MKFLYIDARWRPFDGTMVVAYKSDPVGVKAFQIPSRRFIQWPLVVDGVITNERTHSCKTRKPRTPNSSY
jgi:hypothetical protein